MQGKPWRERKKQSYKHEPTYRRHRHRMTKREKLEFKERMEASRGWKRKERWNAYGSHRNIDTTFSPATLTIRKRRGF